MSLSHAAPSRLLARAQLRDLDAASLARFQDRKFAWHVRTLLAHAPHYRRAFHQAGVDPEQIGNIADWHRLGLPLVRKDDFRCDPESFTIAPQGDGMPAALAGYGRYVDALGPLPDTVPIWSWPRLRVEQRIPSTLTSAKLEGGVVEAFLFGTSGVFLSGGSSGTPVPIRHSRLDRELFQIATRRLHGFLVDGLHRRGDQVVSATLYPQAPHMGFWMTTWGFEAVAHMHLGLSGAGVLPTERLAELALAYRVNVYAGIPSYFRNRFVPALVAHARDSGVRLPERMAISLGGEAVTPACRSDVRTMLRDAGVQEVSVLGGYGASESRFHLWYECTEGEGYHSTAPDMVACRVVRVREDGTWEFVPDGEEGLLVQFPLEGTGTCLTGFILGDTVVMTHDRCPHCGVTGPRLLRVGRASDVDAQMTAMGTVESKIRGATVNLVDLREQLLRSNGVAEIQLVIRRRVAGDAASPDELVVRCATAPGADGPSAAQIVQRTKVLSEITPIVEMVGLDELLGRSLKFPWLVDERPSGAA